MGLLDWLQKRLAGDDKAELILSKEEESLSGLSLKEVLDAHMAWRHKLKEVLDGHFASETYDVATVAEDNLCTLGKWLYGPGKQLYGHLPEYAVLRKVHADFHLCAGEVLIEHRNNNTEAAEKILHHKFRELSDRVQLELIRLFSAAQ